MWVGVCGRKRLIELPLDFKAERVTTLGAIDANDCDRQLGTLADYDLCCVRF
jgi:hypothetical protein